jgi:hypothetical protein
VDAHECRRSYLGDTLLTGSLPSQFGTLNALTLLNLERLQLDFPATPRAELGFELATTQCVRQRRSFSLCAVAHGASAFLAGR